MQVKLITVEYGLTHTLENGDIIRPSVAWTGELEEGENPHDAWRELDRLVMERVQIAIARARDQHPLELTFESQLS